MTIKEKFLKYNVFFSDILSPSIMPNKNNDGDNKITTRSFKRSISVRKIPRLIFFINN